MPKTQGRWYEAMGGLGLEIKRGEGSWITAGYIRQRRDRWEICINPYQDRGETVATCESLDAAKTEFLRRTNAVEVADSDVEPLAPEDRIVPQER